MAPVLQTIAQAQARMGDLDVATQTISEMRRSGFADFTRTQTVSQVVSARLDAGDVAGALTAANLIADSDTMRLDEKADVLERIARQQAERSDPALVLEWARKQQVPNTRLKIARGLAEGITRRLVPREKQDQSTRRAGERKRAE
jgi:hypothetical protein